jgi:hypothetical protein
LEKYKNQDTSVSSKEEEKVQELIDLIDVHMTAY